MMNILENASLREYNSFGIEAIAKQFVAIASTDELEEVLLHTATQKQKLILGGGSNILFTKDYDGLVIKNEIKGIEKVAEGEEEVYVKVSGGEVWHSFVLHCIENNWAGVENLALIPGCVGASPIQNIGAYGVELKDVFHELSAFHLSERTNQVFRHEECLFGYRDSIFKGKYKNTFLISSVTFRLKKQPVFQISYGAIEKELEAMQVSELSIGTIAQAVINIRSSKLPDPKQIGNAGSFFKNPVVSLSHFNELKIAFPEIVAYSNGKQEMKLAAGWLIEQCGWKGYRSGEAGVHQKQALVLVNYGQATGQEIFELSKEIISSVEKKFGVALEREVNIL